MNRSRITILLVALCPLVCWSGVASAEGPTATPEQLGGPLFTPLGAERAGNADGSIPAWDGGITEPPPDYDPGRHETDPFPDDPVLYTVTAENIEQNAPRLSEGQTALLMAYPDTWRMPVYRSRRSASYPDWVYQAVRQNADHAELITEGKGGIRNARVSSPFPIPKTGVELIWNHNLRWRGIRVQKSLAQAAVTQKGRYTLVLQEADIGFPYGVEESTPFTRKYPNLMLALKTRTIEPAFLAGDGGLVIEPIDQTLSPRKSWIYRRSFKRVLRRPTFGYGMPGGNTDGLRTVDQFELYNGSPDMFEWTLLGKQELLIPYNSYRIHSSDVSPRDILQTSHVNPDLVRFELHRVWVVEGRLRDGMRHIYSRRVFYIDEDSWQIAASDSYDLEGNLWRTSMAMGLNYYTVPVHLSTVEVFQDLKEARYLVDGLDNKRAPYRFLVSADPREFSPNALAYFVR